VFQYFPLIPQLPQIFKSPKLARMMTWTATNKSLDSKQRHTRDSLHWKMIDKQWPGFANEVQNVWFGLFFDGMNPYGDKNNNNSCCLVTILNYNIPPWQTINFFIIMVLLVPCLKSALSKNIDIWLAPIIEKFVQLWKVSVPT
jgi:hypothetical protein